MKNRYCIGSKLSEATFRALVRAYFKGESTKDAAKAAKVPQASVKNLYRRITYRLIDGRDAFSFFRELLTDCFETGGDRVSELKKCLWKCPGAKGYGGLPDRDYCTECPFAVELREFLSEDDAVLSIYFERRSLAPLNSFSFVNRAAYIFGQRRLFGGEADFQRQMARSFIKNLKQAPLGAAGTKEQIADRYVNLKGVRPLWYVVSQGEEYHLPDHDMM